MLILPHALHCIDSCISIPDLNWHSLAYSFGVSAVPPSPPHTHTHTHTHTHFFSNLDSSLSQLTRELTIRVEGFVHKRLLTYIEMLIVCVCM